MSGCLLFDGHRRVSFRINVRNVFQSSSILRANLNRAVLIKHGRLPRACHERNVAWLFLLAGSKRCAWNVRCNVDVALRSTTCADLLIKDIFQINHSVIMLAVLQSLLLFEFRVGRSAQPQHSHELRSRVPPGLVGHTFLSGATSGELFPVVVSFQYMAEAAERLVEHHDDVVRYRGKYNGD